MNKNAKCIINLTLFCFILIKAVASFASNCDMFIPGYVCDGQFKDNPKAIHRFSYIYDGATNKQYQTSYDSRLDREGNEYICSLTDSDIDGLKAKAFEACNYLKSKTPEVNFTTTIIFGYVRGSNEVVPKNRLIANFAGSNDNAKYYGVTCSLDDKNCSQAKVFRDFDLGPDSKK